MELKKREMELRVREMELRARELDLKKETAEKNRSPRRVWLVD